MPPQPPSTVHLPNGQTLTVQPVFGGLFFKANDLTAQGSMFPAGWTIIIQSEDYEEEDEALEGDKAHESGDAHRRHHHIHRYRLPTLRTDNLFISSLSNPSTAEFKPPASQTRQIAMMLWATLYWYFHQPEPSPHLATIHAKNTPDTGKPKMDWRINIKREGVFRGRNLLQKLARMGLIASEESCVGSNSDDRAPDGWTEMFVSRRAFWQLSAKVFLFTLSPNVGAPYPGSPYSSRPASPVRGEPRSPSPKAKESDANHRPSGQSTYTASTPGPFSSGSHLPTYYPPPPPQYKMTNGIRHPIRAKPPRQGETFYTRFIPSVGEYLSFRVASSSPKPVAYDGPTATHTPAAQPDVSINQALSSVAHVTPPTHITPAIVQPHSGQKGAEDEEDLMSMSDAQLLHKWMNNPRVAKFWGCAGPISVQETFLAADLESRHSFPVIGCWDGKPFGYFVVYWVKEDILGKYLGAGEVDDWDRGVHVLVGEESVRGKHRVGCWMSSLVHCAFTEDIRTNSFVLEPRIDNDRFIEHLIDAGFSKEKEISFPHKQSAFLRFRRENFDGPVL